MEEQDYYKDGLYDNRKVKPTSYFGIKPDVDYSELDENAIQERRINNKRILSFNAAKRAFNANPHDERALRVIQMHVAMQNGIDPHLFVGLSEAETGGPDPHGRPRHMQTESGNITGYKTSKNGKRVPVKGSKYPTSIEEYIKNPNGYTRGGWGTHQIKPEFAPEGTDWKRFQKDIVYQQGINAAMLKGVMESTRNMFNTPEDAERFESMSDFEKARLYSYVWQRGITNVKPQHKAGRLLDKNNRVVIEDGSSELG